MDRTTVCVVGGGPAGMVLGLLLARAGIEVTVLEKHADFLRDFRGDTVHPPTLDLLDDLGLGEEFAKIPQRHIDTVGLPYQGQIVQIGDLSQLKGRHPYIAMVPQWDFLDLLKRAAEDEPAFRLRMETEATGLLREGGRVVGVTYRTAAGDAGEIRADLTVACDGRSSLLRASAGLTPKEWATPMDVWWFRLPRHETDPSGIVGNITAARAAVMIDRGEYWQCAVLIGKGTDRAARRGEVADIVRQLGVGTPWVLDRVDALDSWDDVKVLDVKLNRLHRWHVDGLLCIGDAAHAMSPVGGIGINLAVQDAIATAGLLADKIKRGSLTGDDLALVRRRRLLPTVVLQGMQRFLHRVAIGPVVRGEVEVAMSDRLPLPMRVLRRFPRLRGLPATVLGRGVRTEPTPRFARR
ncbi:FAD-dependent oxidoreductase [Actinokineospora sp. UTMC 2448]|uniref:FAD-dependent oxidoreductase n=1 Tax=Actinokineospora sp. UTMC 2448 TaxID=2268449 RepID=UPI002164E44B|nr:FAD-dependent oxidoreductase [Actinokineospora sp. UTMC 2448]UVS81208.1 3-(3-hydroxyphenyl)propionate hydroxylase [Actinokineospora sp. UTMC 2448]